MTDYYRQLLQRHTKLCSGYDDCNFRALFFRFFCSKQLEDAQHKNKAQGLLKEAHSSQCSTIRTHMDRWKPQKSSRICRGCVSRVISFGHLPNRESFWILLPFDPDHRTLPIQLCVHRPALPLYSHYLGFLIEPAINTLAGKSLNLVPWARKLGSRWLEFYVNPKAWLPWLEF